MSEEREEYTRENYPSFGKKYNDEKAIISLTSWKARINTVSKTLFSLLNQCPGFHIVLVLSEEEFPKMMDELPDNLKLFVDNELIEVLWVYKNTKELKKIETLKKYPNVPLIVADDDCIFVTNYAQELYDAYKNRNTIISYKKSIANPPFVCMACSLFPPNLFNIIVKSYNEHKNEHDDNIIRNLCHKNHIKIIGLHAYFPFYFHDELNAINGSWKSKHWQDAQRFKL